MEKKIKLYELKMLIKEFSELEEAVSELEFSKMFTNKMDPASAYVEIQSGSGGTEAQDWAEMLLRMYSKWAESRDFNIDITEICANGYHHPNMTPLNDNFDPLYHIGNGMVA